ncbi:MAG TPA: hypothetical protein VFA04_23185 [Bryobacteraceae bacterium]|nr:hypothetical protein [Bryobacteraceae bacterium]
MRSHVSRTLLLAACCVAVIVPAAAAEADALAIDANIQARHLPFGTIADPIYASPTRDQIVGYTRCGDSALWTGHYLAAEAFRYKVTGDAAALANVKQAIAGIQSLIDVTGSDLLARCAVPANSPWAAGIESEEAPNGIHSNSAAGEVWVGNTSRDQYSGVMFGLAVAYDMVDDAGVRDSAAQLVTRLVSSLKAHAWTVLMPDGSASTTFVIRPDEILALLEIAAHVNPEQFSSAFTLQRLALTASVAVPVGVDVLSDSSYFKFNLDYINFYNLVRLSGADSSFTAAYRVLRDATASHQNAFFNMIDRALQGPNTARDDETIALLGQWLQKPRRDFSVNLAASVPVCGGEACQPIPVPLRPPTDFLWQRDPFQLSGGGSGSIESAGIDYILPYWMARYYGVLPAPYVQSSAGVSLAVAPGALATIYGSGLPAATGQAMTQPLPLTLGGATLTVTDSAGVRRAAPLLYASSQQVNFLVPDGTADGTATFTIASGASSVSATALVRSIAPSLFSMSGNGSGVAAATAVEQIGSQQTGVPLFNCDASGCTLVPLTLDAPVYLTLYGTGFRTVGSTSDVMVSIAGIPVPVLYAGAQPQFAGLDQINVSLPAALRGSGADEIVVTVAGQTANAVRIAIQ